MKDFKVGVFEHQRKRSIGFEAYTYWFNPEWKGCCVHRVQAENGKAAKKFAIAEHRDTCMKTRAQQR